MSNVVELKPRLYEAKSFSAGRFVASGTLCGHIDFATPNGTYVLSPDEMQAVVVMLQSARADVLAHSDPTHDPRLYPKSEDGRLPE